ncbi:hypothetical protein P9112_002281 [Eukaryota sp. TZLM1-RC]
MTRKNYPFVGNFCPKLRNRGVSLRDKLDLASCETLNQVRNSCSLDLLPNSQSPNAPPDKQPQINDVFSLANNFKEICYLALSNM